MRSFKKYWIPSFAALLIAFIVSVADARFPHGAASTTAFNGGKFQANPQFPGLSYDYVFVNYLKNSNGNWSYQDNQGQPDPTEVDANGYPTSTGAAIVSHGGLLVPIILPAQAYVGGNCIPSTTGICFSYLANGKGTVSPMPGTITTSGATGTVATGATTTITFSVAQDFRAGMEVPITGTNGTVSPNLTTGGATGSYTVCAAGLTTTTIQLCLNDQTTALTTTGTFTGSATVQYGRAAVGVTSKGRVVAVVTGSPNSLNLGISAQDATTPITYRNGLDGLAMVMQGPEEVRYEQWRAGTCPGGYNPACQFGAANLAKMRQGNPGVIRHLNTVNPNDSLEVNWSDRKPLGYYSNAAYIYDRPVSVWAGTTTSSGNDYAKTFGSGGPVDKQQIALNFNAATVTITGTTNALVNWTGHGLVAGSPFLFFKTPTGVAPANVTPATTIYYAITSCGGPCGANAIRFASSYANAIAGTAMTSDSGTGTIFAQPTVAITTAVIANSSSTITWNDPLIQVGDQISLSCGGCLGYPFNNGVSYFVKTVSAVTASKADITISATSGGAAIVACGSCAGTFNSVKNPTFNLNSTGAVAIKDRSGFGVGTAYNSQPMARTGGGNLSYGTMTYDAVLKVWLKTSADSLGVQFFTSGWPPETALEYCVTLGAHCWFMAPRYTFDGDTAISDYNPSLYAYVRATAPSWMIPRFEPPNEFWNNQFAASNVGSAHAVVYAGTAGWTQNSGYHQAYGKAVSVLGQAASIAYGNPVWPFTGKYQFVAGVQTGNFINSSGGPANAPRLSASDYVGQTTPAPTGYVKSAGYNWATHVAVAQYWSPGYRGTFVATSLANANAGGRITGSISGNQLTVSSVDVVTAPVFGIGSKLLQGPGVTTATVLSGTNPYTLDVTFANPVGSTPISYVASGYDTTAVKTYLDSTLTSASFTGSTSGTTLTATSVTGFITNGMGSGGDLVFGTGVTANTQILAQLTGTGGAACPDVTCTGQVGTYQISQSQTLTSRAMTTSSVFSQTAVNIEYGNAFAFAQGNGTPGGWNGTNQLKMNGYEGGYSPDYTARGVNLTDQLNFGAKINTTTPLMVTGMYGWQANNLANFKAAGGEFPSMFTTTGPTPSSDTWSVLEDIYQPAPTPLWDAYKDYNFLLKRDLDPAANDNDPMWLAKAA